MTQSDEISASIGFYYYEKAKGVTEGEKIEDATTKIKDLDIISITFEDGIATISLTRPGIFIGLRGENINALTEYVKKNSKFEVKELKIVEYKRPYHLYCFRAVFDMTDDFDGDDFYPDLDD